MFASFEWQSKIETIPHILPTVTMRLSLPDDILITIAAHLDDNDLQVLLAVNPTFCHLAMRARYGKVTITDQDPDGLGRVFLAEFLERLRDPFVSVYIREAVISINWTQKRWRGGGVTQRPTLEEQNALLETLPTLHALKAAVIEWSCRPGYSPLTPLHAMTSALAQLEFLDTLSLVAPTPDLGIFGLEANPTLLENLTHLDINMKNELSSRISPDLSPLGKAIARAGDARLASLTLTVTGSARYGNPRSHISVYLLPCLEEAATSTMRHLRKLALVLPLSFLDENERVPVFTSFLCRVAPKLEFLSIGILNMEIARTPESVIAWRTYWMSRTTPAELQTLHLGWPSERFSSKPRPATVLYQSIFDSTLPWLSNLPPCLTEPCLGEVTLSHILLQRLMRIIQSSFPALSCLRLFIHHLAPKTLDVIAGTCRSLVELELHFMYLEVEGYLTDEETNDLWWYNSQDVWFAAITAFAKGCEEFEDSWPLRHATFVPAIVPAFPPTRRQIQLPFEAGVRCFAPEAEVEVVWAPYRH